MYICELGGFLVNGNETLSLKIPSTVDVEIDFLRSTSYDVVPLSFDTALFSILLCFSLDCLLLLFHCLFCFSFCVCGVGEGIVLKNTHTTQTHSIKHTNLF